MEGRRREPQQHRSAHRLRVQKPPRRSPKAPQIEVNHGNKRIRERHLLLIKSKCKASSPLSSLQSKLWTTQPPGAADAQHNAAGGVRAKPAPSSSQQGSNATFPSSILISAHHCPHLLPRAPSVLAPLSFPSLPLLCIEKPSLRRATTM